MQQQQQDATAQLIAEQAMTIESFLWKIIEISTKTINHTYHHQNYTS